MRIFVICKDLRGLSGRSKLSTAYTISILQIISFAIFNYEEVELSVEAMTKYATDIVDSNGKVLLAGWYLHDMAYHTAVLSESCVLMIGTELSISNPSKQSSKDWYAEQEQNKRKYECHITMKKYHTLRGKILRFNIHFTNSISRLIMVLFLLSTYLWWQFFMSYLPAFSFNNDTKRKDERINEIFALWCEFDISYG